MSTFDFYDNDEFFDEEGIEELDSLFSGDYDPFADPTEEFDEDYDPTEDFDDDSDEDDDEEEDDDDDPWFYYDPEDIESFAEYCNDLF